MILNEVVRLNIQISQGNMAKNKARWQRLLLLFRQFITKCKSEKDIKMEQIRQSYQKINGLLFCWETVKKHHSVERLPTPSIVVFYSWLSTEIVNIFFLNPGPGSWSKVINCR